MIEGLMSFGEVRKLLNVHGNTLRRWCNQGLIESYRLGPRGDRRFSRKVVANFLLHGARVPDSRTQVMHLVAQGLSNEEIAERLHYVIGTVRNHVVALCRVYKVHTRDGLIKALKRQEVSHGN